MGVSASREGDSFKSHGKFCDKKTEELLVDLQERAYEQYPELKELKQSCTVTDNSFPDNPIVWVNDEFERMTLYPKEEIIGRNCRFLQGPKTNPLTIQNVKRSIVLGTQIEVEILNYRKDGVAFWNRFFIYPIYERNGLKVTHFIAVQKDVTGAKLEDLGLDWSVCEVAVWLEQIGLEEYAEAFRDAQIDGTELLKIKESALKKNFGMNAKAIEKFMHEREDLGGRSSIFGDSDSATSTSMSNTGSQYNFDAKKFLKKRARERIAIKCYLDSETIRIFAVKRKTSLKTFRKTLRKTFGKRYEVIPIGREKPCDDEGWMQLMNEATEETLRVFINPQLKKGASKLFTRGEGKVPSGMPSQEELDTQKSMDLEFIRSLHNQSRITKESDFMAILKDEKEFLSVVDQSKFTSNMKFPSFLFDFFYNHDATDSLFQWIVKRELRTYPSPNSFFREATLTTNLFSVLFQNEMTRHFLQSTVGITVKKIMSHGKLEIEPSRAKKEVIASSVKWISEEVIRFIENLEKNLNFCPLSIREGFAHLFSVLREKPNSDGQSLEMVSSIFFLRFISPVFMDPIRFGLISETKMEDSQFRSLVLFSKVLQWIANNSVIDSSKPYASSLQNLVKITNPMVTRSITSLIDQKDLNQARIMSKCYHFVTPLAKLSSLSVLQSL